MKVLAVIGSPRKGETYNVVKMLEECLKAFGEVEFEYLFLKDINLSGCLGCHACLNKGEDYCPLEDDRARLEEMLHQADGIILASPVYAMQVTALMKNFLERFSYLWHRPRFFGKKVIAVATGGGQFKEVLKYLEDNAKSWGCDPVAKLGVAHYDALNPMFKEKTLAGIGSTAKRFYDELMEKKTVSPDFRRIMWFRMWRINARACKDSNPCDYEYWNEKGWFQSDYYYKTHIGLVQKLFSAFAEKAALSFMRKMYRDY